MHRGCRRERGPVWRLSILGDPGLETPAGTQEERVLEQVWAEAFVLEPRGQGALQSTSRARRVHQKPHKCAHMLPDDRNVPGSVNFLFSLKPQQ